MRIWFDTEFHEDGKTIDLISIGMVREDGATYYAEAAGAAEKCSTDWLKENVLPHLAGPERERERPQIAADILEFAGPEPEFWAWYADYDWVALCQLYGRMIDLPKGWPMFCRDLRQLVDERSFTKRPDAPLSAHNALSDAKWNWQLHAMIEDHPSE